MTHKQASGLVILVIALVTILFPAFILSILDRGLRMVDRHTFRGECKVSRFKDDKEMPWFDVATVLVRAALSDPDARRFLSHDRFENADCLFTERWKQNKGYPPKDERDRRAAIPAPQLIMFINDRSALRGWFAIPAGLGGQRHSEDLLIFHWNSELDRGLRDALVSAVPGLVDPSTRKAVLDRIMRYPADCREIADGGGMRVAFSLVPVRSKPARQYVAADVTVSGCHDTTTPECSWSGSGFNANRLIALLESCHAKIYGDVLRGQQQDRGAHAHRG